MCRQTSCLWCYNANNARQLEYFCIRHDQALGRGWLPWCGSKSLLDVALRHWAVFIVINWRHFLIRCPLIGPCCIQLMVHVVFLKPGTPCFRVESRKISQLSCGTPRRHAPYLSFIPSDSESRPRRFPNVEEACWTAALLRTLHRTQTSTVPMWRTIGNSVLKYVTHEQY